MRAQHSESFGKTFPNVASVGLGPQCLDENPSYILRLQDCDRDAGCDLLAHSPILDGVDLENHVDAERKPSAELCPIRNVAIHMHL